MLREPTPSTHQNVVITRRIDDCGCCRRYLFLDTATTTSATATAFFSDGAVVIVDVDIDVPAGVARRRRTSSLFAKDRTRTDELRALRRRRGRRTAAMTTEIRRRRDIGVFRWCRDVFGRILVRTSSSPSDFAIIGISCAGNDDVKSKKATKRLW